jgi:two-component system chemotaxis sensor kinase CheA
VELDPTPATSVRIEGRNSAMGDMDDIVKDFLVESNENLDQLDRDLVALEKDPTAREILASIFRTIHTIKGTSGFLGFSSLGSVTHVGENLLSSLRDGRLILDADITSALLALVDAVRHMLVNIENTGREGQGDYASLIDTLTRLQKGERKNKEEATPEPVASLTPSASAQGPEVTLGNPASGPPTPTIGPLPATAKSIETRGGQEDQLAGGLQLGEMLVQAGTTTPEQVHEALNLQRNGDVRHIGEILVETGAVKPVAIQEALQGQAEARASALSEGNIRVDVGLLDKLMNLVGELVLARNQILQFSSSQQDSTFLNTTQRLNLITTELQEGVMKTRMQPIGNIWSKFPRVVRDLATGCGKQIRLEMEGKETELDKTLIEAIKDPLTHVVRNSVDHGIETPEKRVAAGKPVEGRLFLRAFHEGGQVNIEISDDGAGIDIERVKQKALDKSLITLDQASRMNDRELMNLIFLPGLSTAEKVTNVSGRGVGMDVVKTNIEKIGGTVDVHTRKGHGTTLKIKIPLTLAIIPALIVTSGGDRYAIPQVSLLELVRLEGEQARKGIEKIHGASVYRLRGKLLPLVNLNYELRVDESANSSGQDAAVNIVVLQADDRHFGLVVDYINDTEEIVVKPLGKQLKGIPTFAGATIMGDGQVALILDVLGLAQRANVISEIRDRSVGDKTTEGDSRRDDGESLLLLRGPDDGRMAMPLSLVARLEEFARNAVEKAGGRNVVQYRGQILPLIHLSSALSERRQEPRNADPAKLADEDEKIQVVVYTDQGRSVGLVVDRILDIAHEAVKVRMHSGRHGTLGTMVVQGRVTEMLDLKGIITTTDPTFFQEIEAA